jgi:hypothetical protein
LVVVLYRKWKAAEMVLEEVTRDNHRLLAHRTASAGRSSNRSASTNSRNSRSVTPPGRTPATRRPLGSAVAAAAAHSHQGVSNSPTGSERVAPATRVRSSLSPEEREARLRYLSQRQQMHSAEALKRLAEERLRKGSAERGGRPGSASRHRGTPVRGETRTSSASSQPRNNPNPVQQRYSPAPQVNVASPQHVQASPPSSAGRLRSSQLRSPSPTASGVGGQTAPAGGLVEMPPSIQRHD